MGFLGICILYDNNNVRICLSLTFISHLSITCFAVTPTRLETSTVLTSFPSLTSECAFVYWAYRRIYSEILSSTLCCAVCSRAIVVSVVIVAAASAADDDDRDDDDITAVNIVFSFPVL